MTISPEKCFQLYLAIKAHFLTKSYDAVKHNCRIKNATLAHLERRNDAGLIKAMARQFDSPQEAATFFVANLGYGNSYPFDDMEKAQRMVKVWQRRRQSRTKIFTDDVQLIAEKKVESDPPNVLQLLLSGKITPETVAILDTFDPFLEDWSNKYPLWKDDLLRVKKLSSFIHFDHEKFRSIYRNTLKRELA